MMCLMGEGMFKNVFHVTTDESSPWYSVFLPVEVVTKTMSTVSWGANSGFIFRMIANPLMTLVEDSKTGRVVNVLFHGSSSSAPGPERREKQCTKCICHIGSLTRSCRGRGGVRYKGQWNWGTDEGVIRSFFWRQVASGLSTPWSTTTREMLRAKIKRER